MIYRKPLSPSAQILSTNPLAKGLIGSFAMNEGGGTVLNNGLRRLHGTIGTGCAWVASPNGPGLSFNGTANGSVDGTAFPALPRWSIECYFKRNGNQLQQAPLVTDRFGGGHINYFLWFNNDNTHATSLYTGWFDGSFKASTGVVIPDNTWTHAVGVNDGTNVILYVNGVNSNTSGASNATGTTDATGWRMGRNPDNTASLYFSGSISTVKLWNRPLSAGEAQQLYEDSYGMYRWTRWELQNRLLGGPPIRGRMTVRDRRFIPSTPFQAAVGT